MLLEDVKFELLPVGADERVFFPLNKENNKTEQSSDPKGYKSDQLMQAEAILNALKDQEKINQKQKISKTKSFKFDKDW